MTFVKFAEAVDTPEMHAAITQAFKLGQRGLDMLATDQARVCLSVCVHGPAWLAGWVCTCRHVHTRVLCLPRSLSTP